eukprot:GHRR01035467.1.p2 GENE.GHRR01035467.1~~GHRR01035467.1.p2  ORF type:complete len:100 (+),score=9.82 GHRR01035467.1:940-1239(+)
MAFDTLHDKNAHVPISRPRHTLPFRHSHLYASNKLISPAFLLVYTVHAASLNRCSHTLAEHAALQTTQILFAAQLLHTTANMRNQPTTTVCLYPMIALV